MASPRWRRQRSSRRGFRWHLTGFHHLQPSSCAFYPPSLGVHPRYPSSGHRREWSSFLTLASLVPWVMLVAPLTLLALLGVKCELAMHLALAPAPALAPPFTTTMHTCSPNPLSCCISRSCSCFECPTRNSSFPLTVTYASDRSTNQPTAFCPLFFLTFSPVSHHCFSLPSSPTLSSCRISIHVQAIVAILPKTTSARVSTAS